MKITKYLLPIVATGMIATASCRKDFPKEPKVECNITTACDSKTAQPPLVACNDLTKDQIDKLLSHCEEDILVHIIWARSRLQPSKKDREVAELAAEKLIKHGSNESLRRLVSCGACFDDLQEKAVDKLIRRQALSELVRIEREVPLFREKVRAALKKICARLDTR